MQLVHHKDEGMQPTPRHQAAEAQFRHLVSSADLEQPDGVEYTANSVYFRWDEAKVVVAVDLDDSADSKGRSEVAPIEAAS